MAFHEIDSVTDINNGHRVIIYYIECKPDKVDNMPNASKLLKTLEAVMRTLEKKNDDVLIVKVQTNSEQFTQFQHLYKADIKGEVTLFVVNNEGIPIISEHIYGKENISGVILSICNSCALNPVPAKDLDLKSELDLPSSHRSNTGEINNHSTSKQSTSSSQSAETMFQTSLKNPPKEDLGLCYGHNNSAKESLHQNKNYGVESMPSSTQLQIRLPDGSRHKQQFDKEAKLKEVWVFISTEYKLQNFDLKTYNHQNFSEEDYENTLKDLELYPNGVVIVVPKLRVSINNDGWIGSMFRYGLYQLVSKTTNTLSYIQGLCILFWNRVFFSNNRPAGDDSLRRNQIQTAQKTNSDNPSSQRRYKTSTSSFGNIHTLRRSDDDSDDENNRYNGNSTQQK